MFDKLEPHSDTPAYYANPSDLINHLLIIWTIDYVLNSPGKFTKPGEQADLVIVDVVDLDAIDPDTQLPGRLSRKNWWRQGRLIRELKGTVGRTIPKLAWMTTGIATQGRPPYELVDATAHPEAVARGQAWMTQNSAFKPSEATGPAIPAYLPPQSPPPPPPPYVPPSALEQMANRARQQTPGVPPPPPYAPAPSYPPPPPMPPAPTPNFGPPPQGPYQRPEDIPF